MPFAIDRSLSLGHEHSAIDAAISMPRSGSKFPLVGSILVGVLAVFGMSGWALAAYNTAVSYHVAGELDDPDRNNKTSIDIERSASNSTSGTSSSASLALHNMQWSVNGGGADADSSARAAIGSLGVSSFASAASNLFQASVGMTTQATATFSDVLIVNTVDPKNFGKLFHIASTIKLDGGFSHTNVYLVPRSFPAAADFVDSTAESFLTLACGHCGALPSGALGSSIHSFDGVRDPPAEDQDIDPPTEFTFSANVVSGVPLPISLTLSVRSEADSADRLAKGSFAGSAVAQANFTHTLTLGAMTVTDPSTGRVLSDSDFDLVSDSGHDYLHPAAVPEPRTYALLLSGLLALGVAITNKRRGQTRDSFSIPVPSRHGASGRLISSRGV